MGEFDAMNLTHAQQEDFLGLISAIVVGAALLWMVSSVLWNKIQYWRTPRKYIRKQVEILYDAIVNEKLIPAFNSFAFLVRHFKLPFQQLSCDIFMMGGRGIPWDVDWFKLIKKFVEILKLYRQGISSPEDMTYGEVEEMIKELNAMLKAPDEFNCLSCGCKIPADENKCPKCGWQWEGDASGEKGESHS
jgi:hypothetical protein